MSNLKTSLQKLVAQAKTRDIYGLSEMPIQSSYVIKVFEMLGWNDGGMAQGARQDVATGKVPDILLKDANGWTMMVVECKEAGNSNKLDGYYGSGKSKKTFARQLVNYCKAEGVYWGVLTNFIEWRLYTVKHEQIYQNKRYAFHDLLWPGADKNGYIDLLSKEGLDFLSTFKRHPLCKAQGLISQDKIYYPEEKTIREDFFLMLKGWREALRSELWAKNNQLLSDKDKIDLYAQKILDRMIFIDVCHDKKMIGPNAHDSILYTKRQVYDELKKWFVTMDERFNTDLFETDKYIEGFEISNDVLAPIVSELASVDFSRLPVNIIGDVYEDYLGEMLRGGKKQGIKVREDKARFKRKAQGIYYTPEYIVDYIVNNTVGELLEKTRTIEDIKKIKVLDPACGSGSFLINAFDKFYAAYKKAAPDKKDFDVKKTILQNNLYGVDLDERAVEICKLNLMLKALDQHKWDELKGRKLLPSLHLNIRHGNSLISGKSLTPKEQLILFNVYEVDKDVLNLLKLHKQYYKTSEDKEKHQLWDGIQKAEEGLNRRLNGNLTEYFSKPDDQHPLNFEVAFPEVFAQGGFDAVIGNPPWGQKGVKFTESVIKYFRQTYTSVQGIVDLFRPFVEKNSMVLKENGKYGLVLPDVLLLKNYPDTRKYILDNLSINNIDVWGMAFADVNLDSITITATKIKNTKNQVYIKVHDNNTNVIFENQIQQNDFLGNDGYKFNLYLSKRKRELLDKLCANSKYDALFETHEGIHSGNIREKLFMPKPLNSNSKKLIFGRDEVQRYCITWDGKYVNYAKDIIDKNNGEYANLGHPHYFETPKIVIRRTGDHIVANIDKNGYYFSNNVFISLPKGKGVEAFEFILGVLNSRLITWYYRTVQPREGKLFAEIKINVIEKIPIRRIDIKNNKDKVTHDQLVSLVKEMLTLNKTPELREKNQIKIAAVDKEIDELVYKLYGLSEAERKIVEGT